MTPQKVLVIGGTGATGHLVVGKLVSSGSKVSTLSRNASNARKILPDGVDIIECNIKSPALKDVLAKDYTKIVICLGSRSYFGENGLEEMELKGIKNLMSAVKYMKHLDQIVLQSAYGIGRTSPVLKVFSMVLNNYFHYKALIEEEVMSAGIPYTIVRPVELLSSIKTGRPVLNQSADFPLLRFINRSDVAEVIFQTTRSKASLNKVFEVSGSLNRKSSLDWNSEFSRLREGRLPTGIKTSFC